MFQGHYKNIMLITLLTECYTFRFGNFDALLSTWYNSWIYFLGYV